MFKMELKSLLADHTLWNLLIRFFVNLGVLYILIGMIYYRFSKKEDFYFSFIIMGIMIFLVCSILGTVNLQIGHVVGLFAIFAILRFRTVQYTVKEITYVFVIIGISVINSQAKLEPFIVGAMVINASILVLVYGFELFLKRRSLVKATVSYDKIELLKPELRKELLNDLSLQTGLKVERTIIREIDTRKKTVELDIFFKDN
jgi:hypothetical protein